MTTDTPAFMDLPRRQGQEGQIAHCTVALLALLTASCSSLAFRNLRLIGSRYDQASKSRETRVAFEIWDGDKQLTELREGNFWVTENGVRVSEVKDDAIRKVNEIPVALILDTSSSMYGVATQHNSIPDLKKAASEFVKNLEKNGFRVQVYSFARSIKPVKNIEVIAEDPAKIPPDEIWTSLYRAIKVVMDQEPTAEIVVVTDGADNYSHNKDPKYPAATIEGLSEIAAVVDARASALHAVGFAGVLTENDRNGVSGPNALKRLARRGSYVYAKESKDFRSVFDAISQRISRQYVYRYRSPILRGALDLRIHVRVGDKSGSSRTLRIGEGLLKRGFVVLYPGGGTTRKAIELVRRLRERGYTARYERRRYVGGGDVAYPEDLDDDAVRELRELLAPHEYRFSPSTHSGIFIRLASR